MAFYINIIPDVAISDCSPMFPIRSSGLVRGELVVREHPHNLAGHESQRLAPRWTVGGIYGAFPIEDTTSENSPFLSYNLQLEPLAYIP